MLQLEREILQHFSANWTQTPTISWQYFNVVVKYSSDTEYIVPLLRALDSVILETPAESGAVRRDYAMGLNLLLKENTGTSAVNTYVETLRTLFSKKDISTANYSYSFSPLEVGVGVGSGPHFEIPVSVDFYVYSSI
tara:strand:+ start:5964 stop:6374 length:411 start_codon:yes stop_codon:yes gene_type:complete